MKNNEQIKTLIDRFMDGRTSLDEERQLYAFFAQSHVPDELRAYQPMFRDYQALSLTGAEPTAKNRHVRILPLILRRAAGIAAVAVLLLGIAGGARWYENEQLSRLYGGSYIIVNGQENHNLRQIKPHIEATLADAAHIEQQASHHDQIKEAESDVLQNIDDPAEKQRISNLLNE